MVCSSERLHASVCVVALVVGLGVAAPPVHAEGTDTAYLVTEMVSVAHDGTPADGRSTNGKVSGNGRYVHFTSAATNLVPGDTNGVDDIFVRDLQQHTTTRVSVGTGGTQANGPSRLGGISSDGRYVTFQSTATNLVDGDTNGVEDVFRHDLLTATTELVSVAADGGPADRSSSVGWSSMSADGNQVAFLSNATNLVTDDTNNYRDGFVRDMTAGTTTRVSVASDGTEANHATWDRPILSPDGTIAAFASLASNLVPGGTGQQVYVHTLATGSTELVSLDHHGNPARFDVYGGQLSADNRYLLLATSWPMVEGDTNGRFDVFRRDLATGTNLRVSVAHDGSQAVGNHAFDGFMMSDDGNRVAFHSDATNLVPGYAGNGDVYVRDIPAGTTTRVEPPGEPADDGTWAPSISDDGSVVAFYSSATNLVPGDTNGFSDVFVARRVADGAPGLTATLTADQTRVAVGQPVDHHLTLTNTGDTTLTNITITAPDLPGCQQPVADLGPTHTHTIDCTHTPGVDNIGTHTTHATITTDQTNPLDTNPVTVAVRPSRQPDLEIKPNTGTFTGNDTYNHDATDQTATATRPPGRKAVFYTRVTNDGTAPATYQIITPTPLPPGTRLYQGRTPTDLTQRITNRTYTTPRLAPGATLTIRIETTAAPTPGATRTTTLRAKTTGNHVPQRDTTTATLTTR